jgi:hypothetical protein
MSDIEAVPNTDENVKIIDKQIARLGRSCGECYACCVHLGIEALHKWPGQPCKHLDGSGGADKRCTIYQSRPRACSHYYCGWLAGIGSDNIRPDRSGILITLYPPHDYSKEKIGYNPNTMTSKYCATIHITDPELAGEIDDPDSKIGFVLSVLTGEGCNDIRIVKSPCRPGSKIVHMHNGVVRNGRILKPGRDGFEELKFATDSRIAGRYLTVERGSNEEAAWKALLGKGSKG